MSLRTLVTIALGLAFLYGLFTVGFPFLLALIIAIFMEPLNQLLIRVTKMNRITAVTVTCTGFTVGMLGILYLIGLKVFGQLVEFWDRVPFYIDEVGKYIQDLMNRTELFYDSLSPEYASRFDQGLEQGLNALMGFAKVVPDHLISIAGTIPNFFLVSIVFLVALFLFSYALPTMKSSVLSVFSEESHAKVEKVLEDLRGSVFGFIRSQVILSGLTYVISLLGLIILDVNYAMAIALLIVIVDILPILGTGSFLVPWAILETIKGEYVLAIGLVVLFIVITVFRKIIEPKVLGDSVGIGAISALVSLYIGLKLAGLIGVFLGPIVVIIYQAMRKAGLLNIKIKFD
ncbi:sporulation integral membrane protein YtvI [Marinicrinis lubricantis]|uniref:Sporulation integral membrane protein YtvI n=1 Tax=Marinicrinis lubricantis TaxID=2086470 RepID=A0ABW1IIP5_9BACL